MRRALGLAVIALAFGAAEHAHAVRPDPLAARYTKAYDRCLNTGDAARGVDPAMQQCNADELARQDARLNQAYGAAMARLSPAARADLRLHERAWIRHRDQVCQRYAPNGSNGTIAYLEYAICQIDETIRRTIRLEKLR